MTPAYPSRDLYAFATYSERAAAIVPINVGASERWRMPPEDWKRHLEARHRLFRRAGDAAATVADGGPASPVVVLPVEEPTS